jgi:Ca-activated chloride channel homolog
MRFANPNMLWLMLVALPLLIYFLWWAWRKKQLLISQFVQSRLLAHLTVGVSKGRQKARMALVAAAVSLVFLALARPQWGTEFEEVHHRGLDIMVAIDTSKSMLAEDVSPNRLERAKLAVHDLIELAVHDRLGLAPFAGTAFLQTPLTIDSDAFRHSLDLIEVGIIPRGGTSLAQAIRTATEAFKKEEENYKALILLTDGEDHEGEALAAARRAAREGVRIFTVGVGTPAGQLIRERSRSGKADYVRDESGNVVMSRLNEELLEQIAQATGGLFLHLSGPSPMRRLYEQGLASLPRGEQSSRMFEKKKERFQWPLALAILCLLLEMFIPDRRPAPAHQSNRPLSTSVLWSAATRLLLLGFFLAPLHGSPRSAFRKFNSGEYSQALQEYQRLAQRDPENLAHHYNAGVAAYQMEDYEEAARQFAAALTSPSLDLQQWAFYNLGNSLYRIGEDLPDAFARQVWEKSAESFEAALKLNPQDEDSKHNLEVVRQRLEELEPPPPEQGDEEQEQNGEDQDDQNQPQQQPGQDQQDSGDSQQEGGQSEDGDDGQPDGSPDDQEQDNGSDENQQNQDQSDPSDPQQESPLGEDSPQGDETAPPPGQMTPEQARQLLDTHRNEERSLLFVPPDPAARKEKYKDW